MKKQSPIFEYPVLIRESHLDTLGHVNNATYLTLFEEARWDFITRNGYGLKEVHEKQKSPIILEVTIKFKREIRNREKIKIISICDRYEGKIGNIRQTMLNEKDEEVCVADFMFGFFDLKNRKLILPTDEWLRAVQML